MDLKEKLRQIDRSVFSSQKATSTPVRRNDHSSIEQELCGEILESPHGACFVKRTVYPHDYRHGSYPLSSYLNQSPRLLSLAGKETAFEKVDPRRAIFIDTETTGLSGGMGICAFLVGIGYFTEESFIVEQFFMNTPSEERALLHHLNQKFRQRQIVISYNGKCFDFPLLISRTVYHGLDRPFERLPHLDLLFTVRRLWKNVLEDCSLSTVESRILNVARSGDVPGYLIPQIYFDYLRSGDPRSMKGVFYHNEQDILTLVALTTKACEVFKNPSPQNHSVDIISIGKVYEAMNEPHRSNLLYEEYLQNQSGTNHIQRKEVLIRMLFNYKRMQKWDKVKEICETFIAQEHFHPLPYIELAKYYEHKCKDAFRAKHFVDLALKELQILEELRMVNFWQKYKDDLLYRRKRLQRKVQAGKPLLDL